MSTRWIAVIAGLAVAGCPGAPTLADGGGDDVAVDDAGGGADVVADVAAGEAGGADTGDTPIAAYHACTPDHHTCEAGSNCTSVSSSDGRTYCAPTCVFPSGTCPGAGGLVGACASPGWCILIDCSGSQPCPNDLRCYAGGTSDPNSCD